MHALSPCPDGCRALFVSASDTFNGAVHAAGLIKRWKLYTAWISTDLFSEEERKSRGTRCWDN